MDSNPPFRLGHRPCLDGFRGLAVGLVVCFHFAVPGFQGGAIGVDLFFVLSGFLITSLLDDEFRRTGRVDLAGFYRRRMLRLFPALFLLLFACAGYASIANPVHAAVLWKEILYTLTYSLNYAVAFGWHTTGSALAHTWSLAVEEQFYLFWPLCFLGLSRACPSLRTKAILVGTGIAAATGLRLWLWSRGATYERIYNPLETRADALLIGCLAALLASSGRLKPTLAGRAAGCAGIAVLAVLTAWPEIVGGRDGAVRWGLSATALAAAVVLLSCVAAPESALSRILGQAPLAALGRISYGLYLYHWPVRHLQAKFGWSALLSILLSLAVAILSYVLVERHFLKLKRRKENPGGAILGAG